MASTTVKNVMKEATKHGLQVEVRQLAEQLINNNRWQRNFAYLVALRAWDIGVDDEDI